MSFLSCLCHEVAFLKRRLRRATVEDLAAELGGASEIEESTL